MDQPQVLPSLDVWTSALLNKSGAGRVGNGKLEAYGIKKLRELIFELAAKGVLVDSQFGTQSKSVRIEDIAELVMGQAPAGADCNKDGVGTVFVKTGEFGELYPEVVEWTTNPLKLAKSGDVLICVVGATVGKLNLAIDCAIGRSVAAIRPKGGIDTKYLYFALMPYTLRLRSQSRGSAQGVIGKAELNAVEIRLPSEEEQHRIVAKVDELMALCDQLEQQQTDSLAAHQTLVETLLGTLTRVASQQEFSAAWARIASHFDTLFTTEASIDQLKQTLLQLAVMGKLVPQDPNDEPASVLINNVAELRKLKNFSAISEAEAPFEVSNSWRWVRFGDFLEVTSSKRIHVSDYATEGVPFFRSKEIGELKRGQSISTDIFISTEKFESLKNLSGFPRVGDLMLTSVGSIGNTWICDGRDFYYKDGNITKIGTHKYADMRYIQYFIESPLFSNQVTDTVSGTAYNALTIIKLNNLYFPLPPLTEQHRIVAKVDELMALCDALKARIKDVQTTQLHLADAIVEQAVG